MARKLRVQYPGAIYHVMNRGDRREAIFTDDQDRLLLRLCDYVHLNPVRAGLIRPEAVLQTYRWSSYAAYLQEPARRPAWLRVDRLFGEWGIPLDSPAGREQFAGQMEARRRAEGTGEFEPKGWCLGSEAFRQERLAQVSQLASSRHAGEEIRESALAKAQQIAEAELEALGWTLKDLQGRRKSDPQKVRIAARLRRETTMTLEWIAARLLMGAPTHVASLLQHQEEKAQTSGETLF